MKISISNHNTYGFQPKEVSSFKDIIELVTAKNNYSCGIFEGGHRNLKNFQKAYTIGLDIDNGDNETQMTIEEAKVVFKEYKHIIMTSKSHQIEKHGKVADRFRVLLFLDNPIENQKDYYATWQFLKNKYDAIDGQCKDPSRFWYPSKEVVQTNKEGTRLPVVKYVEPVKEEIKEVRSKGKLSRNTLDFITFGAPNGRWNAVMSKACIDIREQGYTKDETIELLKKPTGSLDDEDLRVVDSIYNKEMRYEARDDGSSFSFKQIDDILKNDNKLEWTAERLLIKGGLSIFAGRPKCGKSTIVRQLVKNIVNNEGFLGRETEKTNVLYLALEEHDIMLKEQFNQVGIKSGDPILIHTGMFKNIDKRYENLEKGILESKAGFVVIDTMALFCGIEDLNNYNSVNLALTKIREIARETGAHIMLIHHLSKGSKDRGPSILGSTAITGAVDNILSLTRKGKERFITSQGRGCIPFYSHPLEFNWDKQTYTLGEIEDEF